MPKAYSDAVKLCCYLLRRMGMSFMRISETFHGNPNTQAVRRYYLEMKSRINNNLQATLPQQLESMQQVLVAQH